MTSQDYSHFTYWLTHIRESAESAEVKIERLTLLLEQLIEKVYIASEES